PARLDAAVEELRANGESPDAILALREQAYGRAVAEHLAAVDAELEQWQQRWDRYRAERDALAGASLPPEARAARLDALRHASFSDDELARVQALEEEETPTTETPGPR